VTIAGSLNALHIHVKVNVIICCDTPGNDLYYVLYATERCGYDLSDKPVEPEYTKSEKPMGDYERSPVIVSICIWQDDTITTI